MSVGSAGKDPFISVVIRSKDEADRLRLTLASLERQARGSEIIVVDDGSSDHTTAVLAEATKCLPLQVVRHPSAMGRSAASNAGSRQARGEILLFLDGDTLAGPGLLSHHAAFHACLSHVVGRGEIYHLRQTRLFRDPETGTPWPHQIEAVARRPSAEIERMRVTRAQVLDDFGKIERDAAPGIYSGAGPRQLYDLEMAALRNTPDCDVIWAAASGSNLSIRTSDFRRSGGFDDAMDINEHRELALRLAQQGVPVRLVPDARNYHLTHRSGWRDPLQDYAWETHFLAVHPIPAVALLSVFWASLAPTSPIPQGARIKTLPELSAAARGDRGLDFDVARRAIHARPLGADFWRGASRA